MVFIGQAGKKESSASEASRKIFVSHAHFYHDAASALLIIMKLLIIIIIEDGIEIYEEKIGPASAGSAGPAATALK